ncbi:hypothetical protein NDU88_003093 [Pleurodeles waltl]|uniref:Uncharacterized protein n=1 Tax=Pleurodeles waltl TaxID=8319 RepID=A0AAV7VFC5_PLEWA|nr:hypothetical protein NDU88_003093 [Pleurodeles waltl]
MLAWLLRPERAIPIILTLRGFSGEKILGQSQVNYICGFWMHEYVDGLRLPRLTDARVGDLEGEVSLEELQEALGVWHPVKRLAPVGYQLNFTENILQRFSPTSWTYFMRHGVKASCQSI